MHTRCYRTEWHVQVRMSLCASTLLHRSLLMCVVCECHQVARRTIRARGLPPLSLQSRRPCAWRDRKPASLRESHNGRLPPPLHSFSVLPRHEAGSADSEPMIRVEAVAELARGNVSRLAVHVAPRVGAQHGHVRLHPQREAGLGRRAVRGTQQRPARGGLVRVRRRRGRSQPALRRFLSRGRRTAPRSSASSAAQ